MRADADVSERRPSPRRPWQQHRPIVGTTQRNHVNPLLDPSARLVVGHRGASADAPENTITAFELALRQGAEALELDLHVSADDIPVVIHDPTLDRTTDRTGPVASIPLSQLREADAGARFVPRGGAAGAWRDRGVRIPTLDEVLDAFPEVPLILEIKTPRASPAVRRCLLNHGDTERCVIGSYSSQVLAPFREQPFHTGASRTELLRLLAFICVGRAPRRMSYDALFVPYRYGRVDVPVRAYARIAGTLRRPVHVWTVDDPVLACRYWNEGAAAILTNRPGLLRSARDATFAPAVPSARP